MRTVIGVVAAILVGLALATGVTFTVATTSHPDKDVNFQDPSAPVPWSGVVGYGDRTSDSK